MKEALQATPMLDYNSPAIQELLARKNWAALPEGRRITDIYNFVRNTIQFGYNAADTLPASAVLTDGFGQCNTKATLLMALLRGAGVPCRLRGLWVHKSLQYGILTGLFYRFTPESILHSWVEVYTGGGWQALEGVILDSAYLTRVQKRFSGSLCGWGVATDDIQNPGAEYTGGDTFIQSGSVTGDLGVFFSPDALFAAHSQGFTGLRGFFYKNLVRHVMNHRVRRARSGRLQLAQTPACPGHTAFVE